MSVKVQTYDVCLRPIHYMSVSGGDDSFYCLNIVLNNPDKYPLDMVVHFDLDIDWEWSKRVIDFMEERCVEAGIKFVRIKPRKTWEELYDKYGFPNAHARWCNSDYKLDCKKQLNEWIASQNCRPVAYIGLCADETARFQYTIGNIEEGQDVIYPLAEEGICESFVNEWARTQPIFEVEVPDTWLALKHGLAGRKLNYYRYFDRQGCMLCPFLSMKEMAFLALTAPDKFKYLFDCIKNTEKRILEEKGKEWLFKSVGADVIEDRVLNKWVDNLRSEADQMTIFDYIA